MTFNPNGDAIETVFYLNDTSSMYLPALQKMGFHDPKNEVVDSKMELEFESCPKETLISSDSDPEAFSTETWVSPDSKLGSSSTALLMSPDTRNVYSGTSLNLTSHTISRPSGASMINNILTFTKLENKSEVMNALASKLGLSSALKFYDVCSLTEADSLKHIPRPVYALLFSIPFTSTWETITRAKEMAKPPYKGSGPDEPAIWFKKAINGACGSMGLLHCLLNGPAHEYILPNTILSRLYERSIPLGPDERATMLYNDQKFEDAHQAIAALVDKSSSAENIGKPRRHFRGPIRREPTLEEHEDLLTDDILKFCMAGFVDTNSDEAVTLPLNSLSRGHLVNGRSEGVQPRTFWDPAWYGQDHWPPPSK
ncbi:ubiquitin carboxyl-terminal hydrolase [Botrytis cinerea]